MTYALGRHSPSCCREQVGVHPHSWSLLAEESLFSRACRISPLPSPGPLCVADVLCHPAGWASPTHSTGWRYQLSPCPQQGCAGLTPPLLHTPASQCSGLAGEGCSDCPPGLAAAPCRRPVPLPAIPCSCRLGCCPGGWLTPVPFARTPHGHGLGHFGSQLNPLVTVPPRLLGLATHPVMVPSGVMWSSR